MRSSGRAGEKLYVVSAFILCFTMSHFYADSVISVVYQAVTLFTLLAFVIMRKMSAKQSSNQFQVSFLHLDSIAKIFDRLKQSRYGYRLLAGISTVLAGLYLFSGEASLDSATTESVSCDHLKNIGRIPYDRVMISYLMPVIMQLTVQVSEIQTALLQWLAATMFLIAFIVRIQNIQQLWVLQYSLLFLYISYEIDRLIKASFKQNIDPNDEECSILHAPTRCEFSLNMRECKVDSDVPPSDQFAGSTYSFPSYIFDGQTGPASPVEYPVRRLDPVDLGSEDSEDEKSAFFVTPSHSIRHSPSSKSTSSQHQHLEVSVPDRLGSLSPLSECVEVREVPVKECEVAVEGDGEIDRVDSELSLLDDQYQESLINFSFSDWSAASNISQKSSHSRLLRSHQPLPSLQVRAATILLDPQLSPLNKTQFKPSEPDVIQFDQYELAEKVTIEVEAEVEDVGIKIAPSLKGPIINSIFWADSCDKWNDNSAVVNQAIADSNYDSNHRVVSPRSDRNCNSVTLAGCLGTVAPVEDSYSINMCAEDSGPDSMIQLNTEGSEMDIDADVLYQEACMYDRPLPQGPVTPLQMYSLMPVRADMLSTMTTYSQMDGCNPRILNLLEWAEYDAQTTLPAPPNSVVKEAQRNQRCVTGSKKWADAWHTGKAPVPQSDVSCMRYDKLPSALDTRNLSDPQAPIWNYIGPSMSSNTSSYPEDIISTTSSTAVCVRILTDKSSPRIGSCCHSDDDTICVDRKNNTYRESSRFKNDDVIGLSCVPLSQATFARALVTSLVTGFQSIATATVPPPMPSTCPDNTYQGYHPLDTYSTTLCGSRSTRELTAFSCHLVNTFRADVCTALEVYDLLLSELLSHALTSRSSGKYIESKADPFDLFRGDRLDTMTRNLNATRVLMVKASVSLCLAIDNLVMMKNIQNFQDC